MCFRPVSAQKPITCPACGKKIALVAGYRPPACPFCKENLPGPELVKCPRCGTENAPDALKCLKCGNQSPTQ